MNKTELVKEISKHDYKNFSLTQAQANEILNATLDAIMHGVSEDGKVVITGFGSFSRHLVESHEGRNPKNPKEVVQIAAFNKITFTSGKEFKDTVNK